jgi:hypothetical protein
LFSTQPSPAQTSTPNRIAGTVVNAVTGAPVPRTRVTINPVRDADKIVFVVTGDDGHFDFPGVAAGKYSLQASRRGFIPAAYDQHDQYSTAIVAGAGLDTRNLVFRLPPAAVLTGKVLDEYGEPVRNAMVRLYREDHFSGVSRIRPRQGAVTDDLGSYEFAPVDPGIYFVSVAGNPWYSVHPVSARADAQPGSVDPALDVAYPTTYYGDATSADEAVAIPVRGGDHIEADIHLTPVPSLHLMLHAPGSDSTSFQWPTLMKPAFDGMEFAQNVQIQPVSPGTYEMTGVPAGRYTVRTQGEGAGLEVGDVDLSGDGQELDLSTGVPSSTVSATVRIEGETAVPRNLTVVLRSAKGRNVAVQTVDEKDGVVFSDLAPGAYEVRAGGANTAYSVLSITTPEGTSQGHTLVVAPGTSQTVTLSLIAGLTTVEGIAKRDDKGVAGVMIVLIPKDPENRHELFRRDQSDQDGTFTLLGVVPGEYTAVAIENGWDLDWVKPAVMARYLAHGQDVTISKGAGGAFHMPAPVTVQSR